MAATSKVPYLPQDVEDVAVLLRGLNGNTSKQGGKGFRCKKSDFKVHCSQKGLVVQSWRFQDWDYKRNDLPTYARGLFTGKNEKGQPEICVRGYDKFFNTEEVAATKWQNIQQNTKGPYELSLKENGCIIFISGLHDGSLLVCSKHSTGPRNDVELSHAMTGEKWIDRQLEAVGRTREDLARELRRRNVTAVAELCDDDFEEHILPYKGEKAGLYLHGINVNLSEFMTYPGVQVQAFADEWGFHKTDFLTMDDIDSVKSFLDEVADTGSYNGRDVEGFVIRCKARVNQSGPYTDWFFKYKFEEPYLLYRQWRECTKAMIGKKVPRYRKHVEITEEYLLYVRQRLAKDPDLGKAYVQNHGIIELRDDFLKEKNIKGSDIIRQEYAKIGGSAEEVTKNLILVPIATIGCGKTTIAVALQYLFGWGHVQNDNITGKNRPPRFTNEILKQLEEELVVFADRNNAMKSERQQLLSDVHSTHSHVRLVALNFVHDPANLEKIRRVTQERVFSRGDNHQTIQASSDQKKVVGIMEGFINRYQPVNAEEPPDDLFDAIIDLDPTKDSRHNLETVISQLDSLYPRLFSERPGPNELDDAIKFAMTDYKPVIKHVIAERGPRSKAERTKNEHAKKEKPQAPKKRNLEYMSVTLPKTDILNALESNFANVSSNKAKFFRQLQQTRRVQPEFHVTLIHRAASTQHPELWQKYVDIWTEAGSAENKLGSCQVQLERIVWDNRIMAIVARLIDAEWECVNQVAHITVGTSSTDIKPKESNDLLKRWLEVGSGDGTGIHDLLVEGQPIIDGTVKGVLSR
ncbi:RNA ligase-domain-containing protein [Xylogone sp. PMI_703]|nr:RNA ligase-domain-containing protein [Xylogone sp. PMI_703]